MSNDPLKLTLDANIQHLISKELNKALKTFKATGGASLLLNVDNGEILSLFHFPTLTLIIEMMFEIQSI